MKARRPVPLAEEHNAFVSKSRKSVAQVRRLGRPALVIIVDRADVTLALSETHER